MPSQRCQPARRLEPERYGNGLLASRATGHDCSPVLTGHPREGVDDLIEKGVESFEGFSQAHDQRRVDYVLRGRSAMDAAAGRAALPAQLSHESRDRMPGVGRTRAEQLRVRLHRLRRGGNRRCRPCRDRPDTLLHDCEGDLEIEHRTDHRLVGKKAGGLGVR